MYKNALIALAVGDAVGMPVEFMTRSQIYDNYKMVDKILSPKVSLIHKNLKKAAVTDDTEQNLYLIEKYCTDGYISTQNTVDALMQWVEETNAWDKGYIGPSSLKALRSIKNDGVSPEKAGEGGLTCGAPMRVLASALCSNEINLAQYIYLSTVPTHNTDLAMEAAMSVGYAINRAANNGNIKQIIDSALIGAKTGSEECNNKYVGASTCTRIKYILEQIEKIDDVDEFLDFLYYCIGTGMQANEVAPAVIGIFAWAKDDVWLSIKMGASVGGDTDTIAALAGALSALYADKLNIPQEIIDTVIYENDLDIDKYNHFLMCRKSSIQMDR